MAILVGIDEAGYGPLLGPLVASSVAFSIPDEHLKADMWHLLQRAVGKQKRQLAGRLLITDSKKAYTKSSGVTHLRRSVLASLACAGSSANNTGKLLETLCPDCFSRTSQYPWYADLGDQMLGGDADDISLATSVLKNTMDAAGMKLLAINSSCLDVGHYNRLVSNVKNKANVLFTSICGLIQQALDRTPKGQMLQVIVDRQGGRIGYRKPLLKMFPEMKLKIIRQDEKMGSYELTGYGKVMRIHFAIKADDRFLPVALASMTSKYIRELMMDSINSHFGSQCDDLKPTAGYWQDGQRFVSDLAEKIPNVKYDEQMLIRCR